MSASVALLPDAGPLITLAYADALDLLFKPGWPLVLVDMVLHEITRHQTPTSGTLTHWVKANKVSVRTTRTFQHYQQTLAAKNVTARKSNLGELAIQETMNDFALDQPQKTGVFLFEDHKIARAGFLVPDNCRKISTRAYLLFLEQKGWLDRVGCGDRAARDPGRTQFFQTAFSS